MGFPGVVAQMVKNLPTMQDTQVRSLGWEDPLEKEMEPVSYSHMKNSMDRGPWPATVYGVTKTLSELHTKLGVEQTQLYVYYTVMKF